MTVQKHLQNELQNCSQYQLTEADKKVIADQGVEFFIFKTLTNKKFRKWAIDEKTKTSIQRAIHLSVSRNEPIKLTFPFGAYKLWRLPSQPEVDWAEFFSISYYAQYLAPIAAAYQPGATLTFCSDDLIVERMNNIPAADTAAYRQSLVRLFEIFQAHFPSNLRFEFMRVADLYPEMREFESDLATSLASKKSEYQSLDPVKLEANLRMSALNIRWDGVQDWTGYSDQERRDRILQSSIIHDAYRYTPRRRAFVRAEDKVVIFTDPIADSIPLGSTKSSRTKFWTGFGILEQRQDRFLDRILSPEQLERAKLQEHEIIPTDLIPLKNFSEVWVFSRDFDFSQEALRK